MKPLNDKTSRTGSSPAGMMTSESTDVRGGRQAKVIIVSPVRTATGTCVTVFTLTGRSTVSRAPRIVTRHCLTLVPSVSGASHLALGAASIIELPSRVAGVARQPTIDTAMTTEHDRQLASDLLLMTRMLSAPRGHAP